MRVWGAGVDMYLWTLGDILWYCWADLSLQDEISSLTGKLVMPRRTSVLSQRSNVPECSPGAWSQERAGWDKTYWTWILATWEAGWRSASWGWRLANWGIQVTELSWSAGWISAQGCLCPVSTGLPIVTVLEYYSCCHHLEIVFLQYNISESAFENYCTWKFHQVQNAEACLLMSDS